MVRQGVKMRTSIKDNWIIFATKKKTRRLQQLIDKEIGWSRKEKMKVDRQRQTSQTKDYNWVLTIFALRCWWNGC